MINVKQPLQSIDVDTSSCSRAVESTRTLIEKHGESEQINQAKALLYDVFSLRAEFDDRFVARLTCQYMVADVCKTGYDIGNAPKLLEECLAKANAFRNNPTNGWQFATSTSESSFKTESDAPVAPKKNKGTMAMDLYNIHVKNAATPLTNSQFVELLVKELKMTKSGARTYAYNCFKAGKEA